MPNLHLQVNFIAFSFGIGVSYATPRNAHSSSLQLNNIIAGRCVLLRYAEPAHDGLFNSVKFMSV